MRNSRQKIVPHLWFDREARAAAEFYVRVFAGDSALTSATAVGDTPSGDVELVTFRLLGYEFMAISAGPMFRVNPSLSFIVNFDSSRRADAREALDLLWASLVEGGSVRVALDAYPFSERYGWVEDRYGVSWQLVLANPDGEVRPEIIPSLAFTGDVSGKAEEAMKFYTSIFQNSREGILARYGPGREPDPEKAVLFEDFMLLGQWFAAMDSAHSKDVAFNEALSLLVRCDSQAEIDSLWAKLSAVPEAEHCGWLKDRFGVSWQIVPTVIGQLMSGTADQRARVTQAFLKMKKFDIAALESAFRAD